MPGEWKRSTSPICFINKLKVYMVALKRKKTVLKAPAASMFVLLWGNNKRSYGQLETFTIYRVRKSTVKITTICFY